MPQFARRISQRVDCVKETNDVRFRFSGVVVLAHDVEKAVIARVNVNGEIAGLEFGGQLSRVNVTDEVKVSVEVLDKRWVSQ